MTPIEQAQQLKKAITFALSEFDKECKRIAGNPKIEPEVELRRETIHFNMVLFRNEIDAMISDWENST